MTIRVAINGFGRIGRNILRAKYDNDNYNDIDIVAINDLGDSQINAHLLEHDTVHGKFQKAVDVANDKIIIDNSDEILVTSERNPESLPWSKLKIDVVFECTGLFVSKDTAGKHITAGAKKVIKGTPKTSPLSLPMATESTPKKSNDETNGEKIVCAQTIKNLKTSF